MKTDEPAAAPGWRDIDRAVEAFERAYSRDGAAVPAAFCPPPGDALHLPVAAELVRADLEFAARAGRSKRLDDYRAVFPALFADPQALAGVAFEEYRLRRQAGEAVNPDDYRARYGVDPSAWAAGERSGPAGVGNGPPRDRLGVTGLFAGLPAAARAAARDLELEAGRFPEPGAEVVGFRLVRELGRGAFARVYLAEQADLAGRFVALKLSTKLVAEAQTLARLQHTNIVPVYSIHRAGRFHVVCMPYLGSATLADVLHRLRDQGPVPLTAEGLVGTVTDRKGDSTLTEQGPPAAGAERLTPPPAPPPPPAFTGPLDALRRRTHVDAALWIGAELADGLAHAHDRGIVHRDLKPANVLLSDEGRPMLLDFNLARDARATDVVGGLVGGTPSHMAPEQLAAVAGAPAVIDARSDVYALGLILYELLTGRPPHPVAQGRFRDQIAQLRAARSAPPPPARARNPAVTPAVDAILARCLAPEPADRYPSARHLREDILLHLDNRPLRHTREPSARERARKALRRNPWLKSAPFLAAVLLAVTGIGVGGYVYRTRQLERAEAVSGLAGFRRDAAAARARLVVPNPTATELADGLSSARRALSRYGLPDAEGWDQAPGVARLSSADRDDLRRDLGDVAFLAAGYAHVRAARAADPAARRSALDEALALNRLAADLAPDATLPFVRAQAAQVLAAAGRADEARAARAAAGELPVRAEHLRWALGNLFTANRHREAAALLRAWEPAGRGFPWYWRARGRCHAEFGEWAEAAACYTAALALRPDDPAAPHADRGGARLSLRDFAAARDDYDAAIRLRPDDPVLYRDRAQARLGLGDYNGAVADLDHAGALDPGHTRVFFMRSRVWARAGDQAAARREADEGLKRTPGDELSWVARGLARRAHDPAGAIADFDQALKLNPTSRPALQNTANVLAEQLGRTEDAIAVLDRLIEAHPDSVNARAGRGVLLARLGKREPAHADAAAALTLDAAPFTRYQVAGIYARTSKDHPADRTEALRLLASALRDKEGLSYVPTDQDLDPLRADPEFQKLVEAAKSLEVTAAPARR
jgi:serine/threonine protein kinase/tetratricopeptide (TPR) repeat protein